MKLAVFAAAAVATSALAQEAKKPQTPAEKEMMEKYMKAAAPGPEHKELAKLAGRWKLKVTAWMTPDAPPSTSDATAEFHPMLGGRYLAQDVKGSMEGQPFEGHGVEGFDNVTQEHFGFWVDNMTTGPMVLTGKCAGKACTMKGNVSDALSGRMVEVSTTMTTKDDDHFVWEMRGPGPDGKPFKTLEISYTRAR